MRNVCFKKNRLTQSILSMLLISPATYAQDNPAEAIEEVFIVGSRISRAADFDGPTPVQTIGREDINKSGYNNLQQLLEKIPAAGNGTFSTRGNNQDSSANGASAVSLRGLGADATLVLVNGRRVAISSFAEGVTTGFVDINTIPMSAVERVEVLKDGASAVYGSDAIAGVVNIVLRKDFEGMEVSAGYGNTTDTDNDEKTFSAIWGFNGDNNSNVTIVFDHFSNSTLMNKDRGRIGSANQLARGGKDTRSSRGFPGTFLVDNEQLIDPSCPASSINKENSYCSYEYGPWNFLTPEAERTGLIVLGHSDVSDQIELFTEIGVQHNTSIAQGAPTPLDSEAVLTVPGTHPNNPFPVNSVIKIKRFRTVDAGPRRWDIETDNLRLVLGARGEVGSWNWEVSGQRSRSESTQTGNRSQGWVRTDFLQREINAGNYNPFGGAYNSQATINAITTSLVRIGESETTSFEASMNGELFELPGGTAAIAFGTEYREDEVNDRPDDQFQRGLIYGTESVAASAKRDSTSVFVEIALPLASSFEMNVAGRFDDYSDFGNTTNPMINMRWAPTDWVALRASWGTGYRAPSLAQIGSGPSQESIAFTDTPGCAVNPTYCDGTDYTITYIGNPNLEAEKSESFNIGLIVDATESLRISMDFWKIVQEDKIDKMSYGSLLQTFCNVQDSTVCKRDTPLPGEALGGLLAVNSTFENIGEQAVTGVDFGTRYTMDIGSGNLSLNVDYSYLVEFERAEYLLGGINTITQDLAGEYEYPEHRWVASATWETESWSVSGNINYTGEFEDTPDSDADGILDYGLTTTRTVDSFATVNVQTSFSGIENVRLTMGIDNVVDESVPFAIGEGNNDVYGFVSSQHNPRGRFAYFKVTYSL